VSAFLTQFNCDAGQLRRLRHELRAWLETSEVPQEVQDDAIMATHEAAAGAIEQIAPQETLRIRARVDERSIAIDVSDGRWLPEADGFHREGLIRRLNLIQRLVDDVDIEHLGEGTIIHLRQAFS